VVEKTNLLGNVYSSVLVDLTNKSRVELNEKALVVSDTLTRVAQMKADDMAEKSYFAHTSPEGKTPWYWFSQAGYKFSYAGENLAIDFHESADVEKAWLDSPGHRANILNKNFTEIGIATAEGTYNGHTTTYVVQVFGKPKMAKTPVQSSPKSTTPTGALAATPINTQIAEAVKGESIEENSETLIPIIETDQFIAVQTADIETEVTPTSTTTYAPEYQTSWLGRMFVNQPHVVDYAYKIITLILIIGLLCYIVVQARVKHPRHVMIGALLLVIVFSLMYLNHSFMLTQSLLV
jgi:hypothetical protein